MLIFIFATQVIEGSISPIDEPEPLQFPQQDPEEAYGPTLDWGYGQVKERYGDSLVRVEWAFPSDASEYIHPGQLSDSRNLCCHGTRSGYLALGGKLWADEKYWKDEGLRWR